MREKIPECENEPCVAGESMLSRSFKKGSTLTMAAIMMYRTTLLTATLSFGVVGLPGVLLVPTPTCPAVLLHEDLHQLAANICDCGVNGSQTGLLTTEHAYTSTVQQYFMADTPWSKMPDPHRTIMHKLKDLQKKWKGTSKKKRTIDPAKWGKWGLTAHSSKNPVATKNRPIPPRPIPPRPKPACHGASQSGHCIHHVCLLSAGARV